MSDVDLDLEIPLFPGGPCSTRERATHRILPPLGTLDPLICSAHLFPPPSHTGTYGPLPCFTSTRCTLTCPPPLAYPPGAYGTCAYFTSVVLYDLLPLRLLPPLFFVALSYPMIGLRPGTYWVHTLLVGF